MMKKRDRCYRLAGILPDPKWDPDGILPESVDQETMRDSWRHSCWNWISENVPPLSREVHLPLPDGRIVSYDCGPPYGQNKWPMQLGRTQKGLELVIRQWVEDAPGERLAQVIERSNIDELSAIRRFLGELEDHRRQKRQVKLSDRYLKPRRSPLQQLLVSDEENLKSRLRERDAAQREELEGYTPYIEGIQKVCRDMGLVATPGLARYIQWERYGKAKGEAPQWPTRGLLITSFGITPFGQIEEDGSVSSPEVPKSEMLFQIGGASSWIARSDMGTRALSMAEEHRKWYEKHARAPISKGDVRQLNRRIPSNANMRDLDARIDEMLEQNEGSYTPEERRGVLTWYRREQSKLIEEHQGEAREFTFGEVERLSKTVSDHFYKRRKHYLAMKT